MAVKEAIDGLRTKVLVVEDSAVQAEELRRIFAKEGYSVIRAANGSEGVALAAKERPAAIIADIMMPVMDGYEMCAKIKKDAELKEIPVALLTQLADPEDVLRGLASGADCFLTKPYNPGYLVAKVRGLVDKEVSVANKPSERIIEIRYNGNVYRVHASRGQTVSFLLSTYENAVMQSVELNKLQEELKALNERLEAKVMERTAKLSAEVAERKAAETALKESEERFRALVDAASDAVVCLEPPGKIYVWNKKAEDMFGYSSSEALGKDFHALIVPKRYHKDAYAGMERFFKTGAGKMVGRTAEVEALRKDGAEFSVELSVSAVNMRGAWHSVGIIRDISSRRKYEKELHENLEDLERMNRLMVGRELKMEDLRKEVRALRERLKFVNNGSKPPKA